MKKFHIKKIPVMKIFCITLFAVLIFLFIKDAAPSISQMVRQFSSQMSNSKQKVSTREMDAIKYQSIASVRDADRIVLDKAVAMIAYELEQGNEFVVEYDNIDGFYDLQPYFLEYKLYMMSKVKVQNIFERMPDIKTNTWNLSDEGLTKYFNNNNETLEKDFGIATASDFITFIKSLRQVNFNNDVKMEFNGSGIYHDVKEKAIYITAYVDDVIFNFKFRPYKTTAAQMAPYVSISGIEGGVS